MKTSVVVVVLVVVVVYMLNFGCCCFGCVSRMLCLLLLRIVAAARYVASTSVMLRFPFHCITVHSNDQTHFHNYILLIVQKLVSGFVIVIESIVATLVNDGAVNVVVVSADECSYYFLNAQPPSSSKCEILDVTVYLYTSFRS